VAGSCVQGNEISGSIKVGNFLINRLGVRFSTGTLLHGVNN
jgi:hypothetical protein